MKNLFAQVLMQSRKILEEKYIVQNLKNFNSKIGNNCWQI